LGASNEDEVTRPYSVAFKANMVKRMTGAKAVSATSLSEETGVSQQSLSRWLRQAHNLALVTERPTKGRKPKQWTVDEKLRVLTEASTLSDDELGEFLRREGLHESQLEQWRSALDDGRPRAAANKRMRELERELRRKEKALAEAAALLVLQKKARALLEGEDDDTDEESDE
jgi:transposase-like protein